MAKVFTTLTTHSKIKEGAIFLQASHTASPICTLLHRINFRRESASLSRIYLSFCLFLMAKINPPHRTEFFQFTTTLNKASHNKLAELSPLLTGFMLHFCETGKIPASVLSIDHLLILTVRPQGGGDGFR